MLLGPLTAALPGCAIVPVIGSAVTQQIIDAIDAKLESSVGDALAALGAPGGFESDPLVHVPLPLPFRLAQPALQAIGMAPELQALEHRINQAETVVASTAMPAYRTVIRAQQWPQDVDHLRALLTSPATALQALSGKRLDAALKPLIQDAAHATGVDRMFARIQSAAGATADIRAYRVRDLHAYLARRFIAAVQSVVARGAVRSAPGLP